MLEERGLGESYLEDSVNKMIAYNPDKKFYIKELRNLKGTGLDLKKHEKNLFPERIAYLETIMENDKEFESEPRPLEKFEERPYGWPEEDKLAVSRARRVQRFLSQPFHVAEQFTGIPGVLVDIKETIKGFNMIMDGKVDKYPEAAFNLVGSIEEAIEKGEKMLAEAK